MNIVIPSNTVIGYGSRVIATLTSEVTFPPTGLTLLVGRNGAGKSTFLKYLCGALEMNPTPPVRAVYLPEELGFADDLTAKQIAKSLFRRGGGFDEYIRMCSLSMAPWAKLSKGQKQQIRACLTLSLARADSAQLICLDEMFSGMDYMARQTFWGILEEVSTRSHVLLSLHPEKIRLKVDSVIGVSNGNIATLDADYRDWASVEDALARLDGLSAK